MQPSLEVAKPPMQQSWLRNTCLGAWSQAETKKLRPSQEKMMPQCTQHMTGLREAQAEGREVGTSIEPGSVESRWFPGKNTGSGIK